jgi:hypothetical protein
VAQKSPAKVVTNVSEYFGEKPVERSVRKTQKRKEVMLLCCESHEWQYCVIVFEFRMFLLIIEA